MAITSASIEANGWVLLVTMTATASAAGDFSQYTLDPNGTPRLVVTSSAPGFTGSGAAVVAATPARSLIATKPLRLPVQATAAGARSPKTPDETSLGGGTIRVRIALSQHIYATDTGLALTALAGWRTGEGATTIAVTNNSTLAAPSPIVRWADVPYQRIGGTTLLPLEVVAFAHHPNGVAPIAGVRFSITDGTNTATGWATALSASPNYATGGTGVATRVYRVVIDGSTATPAPLTEGLLRCDFKAFPWIGAARASDAADTALAAVASSNSAPSMTGLTTASMTNVAQSPFVIAYDPNGTWMPPLYIYIEPNTWIGTGSIASNVLTVATTTSGAIAVGTKISGAGVTAGCRVVSGSGTTWTVTTTANVGTIALQGGGTSNNNIVTVSSNPATAAAGVCADAYTTARNAIAVANRTIAARNGQAATAKCSDGFVVRYKAGTYTGLGAISAGTGIVSTNTWEIIEGDPADANPRANIVLVTAANGNARAQRVCFRNLTIIGPAAALNFCATTYGWLDNCEVRGPTGIANDPITIFNAPTAAFFTNLKYWKIGSYLNGQLIRNCQVENQLVASVILNNARLPGSIVGNAGVVTGNFDAICAGNSLRYVNSSSTWAINQVANASAGAAALNTSYSVFSRHVFANNIVEGIGTSFPLSAVPGENSPVVATYTIVEGNTMTGDRFNWLYDDLNLSTIAANDTESSIMLCNRIANNACDWNPTKHDFFADPTVAAQRIGVALSATRNKAKAVGDEIVIAGSPANVYRCITAGTTASTGGPTGTGADITDGTVHWAWFATEARQHGYRPNAVRGWSVLYGVNRIDNVELGGNGNADFSREFDGLNCKNFVIETGSNGDAKYTSNLGGTGGAQPGGGNYKPLAGSPLIARARAASIDVDAAGAPRPVPFAAGALQNDAAVALVPAGTLQATRVSAPVVGLALAIAPQSTIIATRAAAAATGWATTLGTASASLAMRAAAAVAAWTTGLLPDPARAAMGSGTGRADWATVLFGADARSASIAALAAIEMIPPATLAPDNGRVPVTDRTLPTLLPGGVTPPERTLIVIGDFRTVTIPADCLFPPA